MRVCYLSGGRNVPSVRFRLPFFEVLSRRGHTCHILHNHPSRYDYYRMAGWRASQSIRRCVQHWNRWRIRLGRYDAVVLETGLFHSPDYSFETRLRGITRHLIYEIDDAVFLLFPEKCKAIAEMADQVIAGNERIAEWARKYNSRVSIVPTCVDEGRYIPKPYKTRAPNEPLVVGWIGSSGNVPLLRIAADSLRRLSSDVNFEFRVITSADRRLEQVDFGDVKVVWIDVDRCDVVRELHDFDVGIMPMPADDPWMRYKCNAKMIQYMATGVPAIGSALGFNLELISHGNNGLLADDDQWESHLRQLLASPELRRRMGQAGRQTALRGFTVQSQIDRYEAILMGSRSGSGSHDL